MIAIRKAIVEDHPFIYSTYLKNNWFNKDNDTVLKKDTWMRLQHGRLEGLLQTSPVKVACLAEDPDTILGYSIDGFTYIRPQWRKVANIEEMLK